MSDREHVWIPRLKEQLSQGAISRRAFLRYATLLGMASGAAYMWAGRITGEPFASPARAAQLPRGGILRISMRCPTIASPHTYSWIYDSNIGRGVHEYLSRTGQDNITRPYLCERWEASDDLKTWTFYMRDVTWRSGRKFTAHDAAWNLHRVLDASTGSSVIGLMKGYMLNDVETAAPDASGPAATTTELWDANAIEVVDARTLRLNLKEAQVAVPEHLFHYPLGILDPEEDGVFGVGSNGTGPFELTEFVLNTRAVLRRRDGWWGGAAFLDEVRFIDYGDDPAVEAAAVDANEVDGIYNGKVEDLDRYRSMDGIQLYQSVTAATAVARMQVDRPEFEDPRVRKALRLATDSLEVLTSAHAGLGNVGQHHHVSPVHPDYFELPQMRQDIEAARQLLADAGYPDGIDLEIVCKPDPPWELTAVETMVAQWVKAGVRCTVNVIPSSKYWDVWRDVPFGFTEWAHRPLGFMALSLAYRSGVPWNESHYSNPEFDRLLTEAEGTLDVTRRAAIIGRLEEIMQEDGPIVQPIWRAVYAAYHRRVRGFRLHPTLYIFPEQLALAP
jgi:peptide/nickel transport system substrate-binding protein